MTLDVLRASGDIQSGLQFAAVEAYRGDYSDYLNKTKSILKSVGNYVYNNLKSNKVLINPPQGAFYLMPEFLNTKFKTSNDMCEDILYKTGVALLPGSDFGFKPNKMLARLSYTDFNGEIFLKNISTTKSFKDRTYLLKIYLFYNHSQNILLCGNR